MLSIQAGSGFQDLQVQIGRGGPMQDYTPLLVSNDSMILNTWWTGYEIGRN